MSQGGSQGNRGPPPKQVTFIWRNKSNIPITRKATISCQQTSTLDLLLDAARNAFLPDGIGEGFELRGPDGRPISNDLLAAKVAPGSTIRVMSRSGSGFRPPAFTGSRTGVSGPTSSGVASSTDRIQSNSNSGNSSVASFSNSGNFINCIDMDDAQDGTSKIPMSHHSAKPSSGSVCTTEGADSEGRGDGSSFDAKPSDSSLLAARSTVTKTSLAMDSFKSFSKVSLNQTEHVVPSSQPDESSQPLSQAVDSSVKNETSEGESNVQSSDVGKMDSKPLFLTTEKSITAKMTKNDTIINPTKGSSTTSNAINQGNLNKASSNESSMVNILKRMIKVEANEPNSYVDRVNSTFIPSSAHKAGNNIMNMLRSPTTSTNNHKHINNSNIGSNKAARSDNHVKVVVNDDDDDDDILEMEVVETSSQTATMRHHSKAANDSKAVCDTKNVVFSQDNINSIISHPNLSMASALSTPVTDTSRLIVKGSVDNPSSVKGDVGMEHIEAHHLARKDNSLRTDPGNTLNRTSISREGLETKHPSNPALNPSKKSQDPDPIVVTDIANAEPGQHLSERHIDFAPHPDIMRKAGDYERYSTKPHHSCVFALAELIDNSLSATKANVGLRMRREITVSLVSFGSTGVISIKDNGCGMNEVELSQW
eukprot:CAMPEP_0175041290 /NCGR_PEP_ID=MMETSP0052_2-20121109/1823_1 /TAXON_ID=51329 ORGANISM="Polytomella parva, Strain SAG 63-3" /NCGR_SAMPLE_ID=MMETSP0052_2 /ASSEMBLY_ACC=CAM_ASM_000194 /LENGTH=650 /DNA_ID=CAMNT_0016303769 /DNA_START=102 /DNA_END=2051 /DNA_ORIENTATION=+